MTEPGLSTPLQPVRRERGLGPLTVGFVVLAVLGVIVWRPWSGAGAGPSEKSGAIGAGSPAADRAKLGAGPSSDAFPDAATDVSRDLPADSDLFAAPTTGPWSGRVGGEWSIVAFLRRDPTRDSLSLRQQKVAVFVGLHPPGTGLSVCDARGRLPQPASANLPTPAVYFLGIAFPSDRQLSVTGVYRLGESPVRARPVELGRIPGPATAPQKPVPTGDGTPSSAPTIRPEPVRMFSQPDGGAWPAGVYRFDIVTRDGLPGQLYACIRP